MMHISVYLNKIWDYYLILMKLFAGLALPDSTHVKWGHRPLCSCKHIRPLDMQISPLALKRSGLKPHMRPPLQRI